LIRIPKLVNQAKKLGMSAISLTDNGNLFAANNKLGKHNKHNILIIFFIETFAQVGMKGFAGLFKNTTQYAN
jgi:DNA polymerase III alpha subunit